MSGMNKGILQSTNKKSTMKRLRHKIASAIPRLSKALSIGSKRPRGTSGDTPNHSAIVAVPTSSPPKQPQLRRAGHKPDNPSISVSEVEPQGAHRWSTGEVSYLLQDKWQQSPQSEINRASSVPGHFRSRTGSLAAPRSSISRRGTPLTRDEDDASPPNTHRSSQCSSPGNVARPLPPEDNVDGTSQGHGSDLSYEKLMAGLRKRHLTIDIPPNDEGSNEKTRQNRYSRSITSSPGAGSSVQLYPCDICSKRFRDRISLRMH
ncbi:hypothetical protein FRC14_000305 [Serendipita sp. 396]|nr:hypothetical protein FRC14_000305 [Serendipita sp. 396]KAG8786406.1 hypothetical protein FRC15_011500 [Serendipita sp. 397]KAG8801447.1 hypothetical protein FRC16_000440 [Serendipita sp. 398]KAG8845884.1 hypothetical protein FRB91_001370 [Serendipita sp. 411]KAG8870084.1 hypothetical protein FRC20_000403 [Serendipita sp. 405]